MRPRARMTGGSDGISAFLPGPRRITQTRHIAAGGGA